MAEKKATTKTATAKKATASNKAVAKDALMYVNAESVGFRAGDVYQTLAAAGKALSIAEIAKDANISVEETYLGIGWLFKEGKVKDENNNLITLA